MKWFIAKLPLTDYEGRFLLNIQVASVLNQEGWNQNWSLDHLFPQGQESPRIEEIQDADLLVRLEKLTVALKKQHHFLRVFGKLCHPEMDGFRVLNGWCT